MTKKVTAAGPFEMPFLLPMNHKYSLEVVDTHWQGNPTKKLACAIANGATGSDEYDRDVMNVQVSCQPTQIVNGALGKGTREQRMFHKLGLKPLPGCQRLENGHLCAGDRADDLRLRPRRCLSESGLPRS